MSKFLTELLTIGIVIWFINVMIKYNDIRNIHRVDKDSIASKDATSFSSQENIVLNRRRDSDNIIYYANVTDNDLVFQNEDIIASAFKYFSFSSAAYYSEFEIKEKKCKHARILNTYRVLKVAEVPREKLSAFVSYDVNAKEIVVSFRGSKDWFQIFDLVFSRPTEFIGDKDAKVRKVFYDYASLITKEISGHVRNIFENEFHQDCKLVLTGHSLGGALAMLSAIKIKETLSIPYNKITIFTYGQPRVGNEKFATWYNSHFVNYYRIVNGRDLVPHLPTRTFNDYSHVTQEIFIDDYGNAYFCKENVLEDPDCSNSFWYFTKGPHRFMGSTDSYDEDCSDNY